MPERSATTKHVIDGGGLISDAALDLTYQGDQPTIDDLPHIGRDVWARDEALDPCPHCGDRGIA